ncbi:hypothetical protein GCM10027072_75770 [Streptomyces bullii]
MACRTPAVTPFDGIVRERPVSRLLVRDDEEVTHHARREIGWRTRCRVRQH